MDYIGSIFTIIIIVGTAHEMFQVKMTTCSEKLVSVLCEGDSLYKSILLLSRI